MSVDDINNRIDRDKGLFRTQREVANELLLMSKVARTAVEALEQVESEHPAEPEKMILTADEALTSIRETLGIQETPDGQA